jgi:hypothetical protein
LCSSRNPLGDKYVEFPQLNGEEQTTAFMIHLGLRQDRSEYHDNMKSAKSIIVKGFAGLSLSLAMAAGYIWRGP